MFEQLQQMQQLVVMAAQALAEKGDARVLQAVQEMGLGVEEQASVDTGGEVDMEKVNDADKNIQREI